VSGHSQDARIRPARADDIAFMVEAQAASPGAAHWQESQYQALFETEPASPCARLAWLAEQAPADSGPAPLAAGMRLGFLVARQLAPEWELENIVVVPRARRKGVGEALLASLLSAARAAQSRAVFLEVRASNAAARALYEKLGFHPSGSRKAYYRDPREDAILYTLNLIRH
jgi:[ribosomal protein S18]-alanine N-acetyltransferase